MVTTPADRFRAKTLERDGHLVWTGATNAVGVGVLKVDGRMTTARRAAWELEHGKLMASARVTLLCDEPSCVLVEHLAIATKGDRPEAAREAPDRRSRRAKGAGSVRARGDGVWELAVSQGADERGRQSRVRKTFRGSKAAATKELARLVVEVQTEGVPEPTPRRGGPSVDDLVQGYWAYAEEQGRAHSTLVGYKQVYKIWLESTVGKLRAADLSQRELDKAFGAMRAAGLSHSMMNTAKVVLSNAYKLGRRYRTIS